MMVRSNVRNLLVGMTLPEVLQFRADRPDIVEYVDEWLEELYDDYAGEPCMTGTMVVTVKLLGTGLTIPKGCVVALTAATNLPYMPRKWFAEPVGGWDDNWGYADDASILVNLNDLTNLEDYDGRDLSS